MHCEEIAVKAGTLMLPIESMKYLPYLRVRCVSLDSAGESINVCRQAAFEEARLLCDGILDLI